MLAFLECCEDSICEAGRSAESVDALIDEFLPVFGEFRRFDVLKDLEDGSGPIQVAVQGAPEAVLQIPAGAAASDSLRAPTTKRAEVVQRSRPTAAPTAFLLVLGKAGIRHFRTAFVRASAISDFLRRRNIRPAKEFPPINRILSTDIVLTTWSRG